MLGKSIPQDAVNKKACSRFRRLWRWVLLGEHQSLRKVRVISFNATGTQEQIIRTPSQSRFIILLANCIIRNRNGIFQRSNAMKRGLLIPIFLICQVFSLIADPVATTTVKFEIIPGENISEGAFSLNRYLFVHRLYMDIFSGFGLIEKISTKDKIKILSFFEHYLSKEIPIFLYIGNFQNQKGLMLALRVVQIKDRSIMVINSNVDLKTRELLPPGDFPETTYTRLNLIKGEKVIGSNDLYDGEKEKKLLADQSDVAAAKNNLADMYLFDEIQDNDGMVEKLLLDAITSFKNTAGRFVAKLTLAQYYLFINKPEKVETIISECKQILSSQEDKKNWDDAIAVMEEEYFIFTNMK
jgi:hypothetical protein